PYHACHMGRAAERTARTLGIGREAQDRFAAESYRRAQASIAEGRFRAEIVPVTATGRRGPATVDTDEEPSRIDFDRLPGLRPAFEAGGTITAANASTIADGAAALVGTSGARVLVTLLHALEQRGLRRGLATLCLGGGEAVAMVIERDP